MVYGQYILGKAKSTLPPEVPLEASIGVFRQKDGKITQHAALFYLLKSQTP